MARFLFTCWPLTGHVFPPVSIAHALRARGHSVAFYTGNGFRPLLEGEGFEAFGFHCVDEARVLELVRAVESATPTRRAPAGPMLRALREWVLGTVPAQVADLRPIIASWRPDVLVADLAMWGPILVLWETTGLPVALSSTFIGPLVPGPDAPPWGAALPPPRGPWTRLLARGATLAVDVLAIGMRRRVDRLRASYGLGPLGMSVNAFTGRLPLYLVPSVPELDYNRRDLPTSVHYVGPCVWNKPSGERSPAWLDALPADQPWVHVTEGTLHHQDPFVLRAAAHGLAGLPLQAILTTGLDRAPESLALGPLAPNVHVARWVSHADILPRCAALVTTGGAGTVMAALQAGVPMVIVPTTWEKPETARRVVDAGAAVRLSPRRCTPMRLRAAVEEILNEPRYRANAQRLARRLATERGPERAAQLIEGLVPAAVRPVEALA